MIEPDPELERLIAPLRDGPVALRSAEEAERRRTRYLGTLNAGIELVPQVRRRRRVVRMVVHGAALQLALSVFALGGWLAHSYREPKRPALTVENMGSARLRWIDANGRAQALAGASELAHTGELEVPAESSARMVTHERVRIDVAGASRLRIEHQSERGSRVFLARGEVHCQVPKLPKGREFAVDTPAARIIVHGTDFSIRVAEQVQASTCVRVREGLVEVQRGGERSWLGPGSEWGCEPARAEAPATPRPKPSAGRSISELRARKRDRHARSESEPRGTLDAENGLLAAALRAEQAGESSRAKRLFARLLRMFPASPLAPEAKAGLARLH